MDAALSVMGIIWVISGGVAVCAGLCLSWRELIRIDSRELFPAIVWLCLVFFAGPLWLVLAVLAGASIERQESGYSPGGDR